MQKRHRQIDGNSIAAYESGGSGADVLLIHGRSLDAQTFRHQLGGTFGDKHRVVAFDLPGHGDSSPAVNPQEVYSAPGYARIVAELVDRLDLSRPVVVGWSLGGGIALEAADQLPGAAGFFIFGAPPLGSPPAMQDAFRNVDYIRTLKMPTLWRDEVQIIEGAGHAPHWERPERFNALLADFVAGVTQRA